MGAATRVGNIRTQHKTAPLRRLEFGLNKGDYHGVSKHKVSIYPRTFGVGSRAGKELRAPTLHRRSLAERTVQFQLYQVPVRVSHVQGLSLAARPHHAF